MFNISFTSMLLSFKENIAWGFPKGSPYLDLMSFEINRLKESGLVKKLFQKEVSN
jgi:hypothetical protein